MQQRTRPSCVRRVALRLAVLGAAVTAATVAAPKAEAFVYVTGSLAASTSNVPYTTYESTYGSASLAFDLGRYVRLGFTHSQEIQVSDGYKAVEEEDASADATPAGTTEDGKLLIKTVSRTHVISNSIDLTLILYEGDIFVPYLMGGAVIKQYKFQMQEGETTQAPNKVTVGPVPNIGVGVGMRLNKDFTLKLSYIASPGVAQAPEDPEPRGVWDKKVTIGLTYQL
jgi:hypothetical protein